MSSQWIAFFAGGFLGCILGMGVLSLCVVAGRSDRNMESLRLLGREHADL